MRWRVDVANVIVVAQKFDTFFILLKTSSTELTNQLSIYKIIVINEDIELYVFNFWKIIQMNSLEFWNMSFLTAIL